MSAAYQLTRDARLSLSVNNVFDKAPPRDSTWARWPYYNNQNYNIYGRAYYLELDWAIGANGR
jgi:outer membrane receptor for ferrienterochelin and colicin